MTRWLLAALAIPAVAALRVELHVVHLQPSESQLAVREIFLVKQDDARGELRFFVPEAARGSLRVTAQKPQGSPEEQTPRGTAQQGVYTLELRREPGETRIDVSYTVPLGEDSTFLGKTFHPGVPLRLVVPRGLALEGEGVEPLGEEPGGRASIYGLQAAEYQVGIREEEAAGEAGATPQAILPWRVYDSLPWILGPTLAALALLFILNYLKGAASGGGERQR